MFRLFIVFLGVGAGCLPAVQGQTTSSTPTIGFIRKDLPAHSDTRVSIPLERQAAFCGPIETINGATLTFSTAAGWSTDQFTGGEESEPFYVLFLTGAKKGLHYTVASNTANSLTLRLEDEDLSAAAAGDRIKLLPYWSFDQAFPFGQGIETSPTPSDRQTEILVPNDVDRGTNLSSIRTYYYAFDAWRELNALSDDRGNDPIPPHSHFIVRNREVSTTAVFVGVVPNEGLAVPLRTRAGSTKQDNAVALPRPTEVSLRKSGLIASGAFRGSVTPADRTDELLVYDDTELGINKSAVRTYYYWNATWLLLGDGAKDHGDDVVFEPGTGVVIRKAGNGGPDDTIVFWHHNDPSAP